eukprot:COSAG01_NODE_6103_length_3849_cov_7.994400_5_plen_53_part_00
MHRKCVLLGDSEHFWVPGLYCSDCEWLGYPNWIYRFPWEHPHPQQDDSYGKS